MNLVTVNHKYHYELENLVRAFFPNEKINVTHEPNDETRVIITELEQRENEAQINVSYDFDGRSRVSGALYQACFKKETETAESYYERKMAVMLFELLCDYTGYTLPWGILTGVRPAKLMTKLSEQLGEKGALEYFLKELHVSAQKATLAVMVARAEAKILKKSKPNSFSLYVSIPFCPTRCSYCSFVSHSNNSAKKLMPQYVELLCKEIEQTGKIARELNLSLESVYIGGGTPTALDAQMLKKVTDAIGNNFHISDDIEYTIESGRPDSITKEKLDVISQSGAQRISINPQTFNDSVLEVIGRKHSSQMTCDSMKLARKCGFDNINMDIIAGLPTDTLDSFDNTLTKVLSFSPENITVHTLALKRSSTLVTEDKEKGDAEAASQMLSLAFDRLFSNGYRPYYMYRQSKCLGNLENVGWAKKGYECDYNVYMMEECHTILAVGAGAVTKLKSPISSEIERIFNYKYPYEYI
ncbi:MAG: coproporphyrinogen dehydrogenase HemZ, partial [Ruminococcus sp.]|nr:coproporphyrinogen dehydrogenase HemZ [Ruminococcus sp.]